MLVAIQERNRLTDNALQFAMTLSPDVIAIHLTNLSGPESHDDGRALEEHWRRDIIEPLEAQGIRAPRLMLLPAPFREIHGPLLKLIEKLDCETPGRSVAVLIPELVRQHPLERLLHSHRAAHLRKMLMTHGNERVKVITAPLRR